LPVSSVSRCRPPSSSPSTTLCPKYSDGVSEDAREPYNGCATIDGDLLRLHFGRLPRSNPDAGYLAPELDPIPISDILIED
jgi:hypothetical protein